MIKKIGWVVLASVVAWMLLSCRPSRLREPGGTPEGAYLALNDPDEYAWQLFFFINRPAQPGQAGVPDLKKSFGDFDPNRSFVWETWALASGDNKSEVFLPNGEPPSKWEDLPRAQQPRTLVLSKNIERQMMFDESLRKQRLLQKKGRLKRRRFGTSGKPLNKFVPTLESEEQEIRMNRAAFEGIVKQEMYSANGLEKLLQLAQEKNDRFSIKMDLAAKEIKAEWLPLTDESWKKRYIWREGPLGPDGKRQAYGLVALHITTKDLRDWFWADFGHVDCEEAKNACNQYAKYPGNDPLDTTTRGPKASHGVNGIRKETVGTPWENYILRGTQTGFIKPDGQPTMLSNPVLEDLRQDSSCITCHAYATVGPRKPKPDGSDRVTTHEENSNPGVPKPTEYQLSPGTPQPGIKYLQTDFMWAPVILANRKKQITSLKMRDKD